MTLSAIQIILTLLTQSLCVDSTNVRYYDYPQGLGGYGVVDEGSGRSWFVFDDLDDARYLAYEVAEAAILDQDTGSISVGQLIDQAYDQMLEATPEELAPFLGAYVPVQNAFTSVTAYAYEQPPPEGVSSDFCADY